MRLHCSWYMYQFWNNRPVSETNKHRQQYGMQSRRTEIWTYAFIPVWPCNIMVTSAYIKFIRTEINFAKGTYRYVNRTKIWWRSNLYVATAVSAETRSGCRVRKLMLIRTRGLTLSLSEATPPTAEEVHLALSWVMFAYIPCNSQ